MRSTVSPLNRNLPSSVRAWFWFSGVPAAIASSTVESDGSSSSCCEKYEAVTLWPMRTLPPAMRRTPSSDSTSEVLPVPFGPISATRWPRSMANVPL